MWREYKIKKKGFWNRILIFHEKGLWGIVFGALIFILIAGGALYSISYSKRFSRGYVRLDHKNITPQIWPLSKIFRLPENEWTHSPTGQDASLVQDQKIQDDQKNSPFQEDAVDLRKEGAKTYRVISSVTHPLGTDGQGWDILERLLAGCRDVLFLGVVAVSITLVLGTAFGIFSGYLSKEPLFSLVKQVLGKRRKTILPGSSSLYLGDLVNLFPTIVNIFPRLVLIVIIFALWKRIDNWSVVIAIGIINVPKMSFIIKDQIEHLKNQEFIEAARELGVPHSQIILKHILWYHCRPIILVQMAFILAEAILVESSLSYLGHGLENSWGGMVALEKDLIFDPSGTYWPIFFPAFAIVITIIAFNTLGDGLSRCLQIKK